MEKIDKAVKLLKEVKRQLLSSSSRSRNSRVGSRKNRPATERQRNLLKRLRDEVGAKLSDEEIDSLSIKEASKLIEELLSRRRKRGGGSE